MVNMLVNSLGSLVGWKYIPDIATRQLLPFFHKFYRGVLHRPIPAPNTPAYHRHYRFVYAFVVIAYLLYNFREAALSTAPNYYEILGASPTADEGTLKVAFRQFAKKNHPDRVGQEGETLFMEVRDSFEALKNPITRFAYDRCGDSSHTLSTLREELTSYLFLFCFCFGEWIRFGPEALKWTSCTTLREYIRHGLIHSCGYYVITGCVLLLWTALSSRSSTTFWRYILFAFQLTLELLFILSPSPSSPSPPTSLSSYLFTNPISPYSGGIFSLLWPNRVAYQHIKFLHSLCLMITVALVKVSPVLFDDPARQLMNPQRLAMEFGKLGALAQALDREASTLIQLDLHSCQNDPSSDASFNHIPPLPAPSDAAITSLTKELENMIIESKLLNEAASGGPMKSTVESAIEKRRRAQTLGSPSKLGLGSPSFSGLGSPARGVLGSSSPLRSPRNGSGTLTPTRRGLLERRESFSLRFGGFTPGNGGGGSGSGSQEGYVRGRSQSL